MPIRFGSTGRSIACAAVLALLAGCADAPTAPQALRLAAGGREWLAIVAPTDLPTAATWAPFLNRQGTAGKELAERVRGMEKEADSAQLEGRFARASTLRRDAETFAVGALTAAPSPDVVLESAAAVDRWLARVDGNDLASELLAVTVDSVRTRRVEATAALAVGDTLQALRRLVDASAWIRLWSPFEIASSALTRAERSVGTMTGKGAAAKRARHLAASARQELRTGDPLRALERALYAIQISNGAQLDGARPDSTPVCGESRC